MSLIKVIDSHTEGEPTRVVMSGGPDLGPGSAADRLDVLRQGHDGFRSAVVNEPRGYDALVGAILLDPVSPDAAAQVIFFNNVGYLQMCVHGTIGVGATLLHAGRIGTGVHRIETPAGDVSLDVAADGRVAVQNVPSRRTAKDLVVRTRSHGTVVGDVAWGGNWFFLVSDHGQDLSLSNKKALTDYAWDVRASLGDAGITGDNGDEIDHVELFGAPTRKDADSKNFVLCPGREYDRSPCGTGTSAKMACLFADGLLPEGRSWRQESILGTVFEGTVRDVGDGVIVPTVSGRAWVTAETTLVIGEDDPFREGIR
ncbi:MAG: proline racemase family protein [Planctomycetes bacterium]|nr:proline racemase family protein [Planctomycetota bacterium]